MATRQTVERRERKRRLRPAGFPHNAKVNLELERLDVHEHEQGAESQDHHFRGSVKYRLGDEKEPRVVHLKLVLGEHYDPGSLEVTGDLGGLVHESLRVQVADYLRDLIGPWGRAIRYDRVKLMSITNCSFSYSKAVKVLTSGEEGAGGW